MADENLPSNSLPKKETVRITLPPRVNEAPAVKRETVRIAQNTPSDKGQTIRIQPVTSTEAQPKKETTRVVSVGAIPPPPNPAGIPAVPPRPPSGPVSLPATGRPAISKPAISAPAPVAEAPAAPVAAPAALKPNAPKKETSRIQIPAPTARMQMPKATVKLQQTQPLPQGPAASIVKSTAAITSSGTGYIPANAADPMVMAFSAAMVVLSLIVVFLSWSNLSACA